MKKLASFLLTILILTSSLHGAFASSQKQYDYYPFNEYGIAKGVNISANDGNYTLFSNSSNWEYFPVEKNVPLNKAWTVVFSKEFTIDEIDGIVIQKDDKFIPVEIELSGNDRVTVKPVYSYEPNSKYTLKIFLNNSKRYSKDFYTEDEVLPEINFSKDSLIRIEADPSKGFYAPYYLFIPKRADKNDNSYLLVEPNNTGYTSDNQEVHEESARDLAQGGFPNIYARRLNIPLLVPCFVRPSTDWYIYTHALDSDTLKIKDGYLKRIDLQLLNMVGNAKEILAANGLNVNEKIFMTGYSASGNFTNRFVALHPDKVRAVASGGVNGMPILPLEELDGYTLNYHIGIADL